MTAHIFISYAHKDGKDFANRLRQDLEANHFNVWTDTNITGGEDWNKAIDAAIDHADCILVLLTPMAIDSPQVLGEWNRALTLKKSLIPLLVSTNDAPRTLAVLQYIDFRDPDKYEENFIKLARRLRTDIQSINFISGVQNSATEEWFHFKDRDDVSERIRQGIATRGGEDFFIIIGAPKMGKTWFINDLKNNGLFPQSSAAWKIKRVDLADDRDACGSANILLSRFLDQPVPAVVQKDWLEDKTRELNDLYPRILWLLDDAHFLDEVTQKQFRSFLNIIHDYVMDCCPSDSCFGFVAAARHFPRKWQRYSARHTFTPIELQPLREYDIHRMLEMMLKKFKRETSRRGKDLLASGAAELCRETQGLPGLLYEYISYLIEHFATPISNPDTFAKLAVPYIRQHILNKESLLPHDNNPQVQLRSQVLAKSLMLLCSYRIFVSAHVSHIYGEQMSQELQVELHDVGWEGAESLYEVIQHAYLNRYRDDNFYWQFYPAVRKLLFRYIYEDSNDQIAAHRHALRFYDNWRDKVTDHQERIRYAIEALWHEAEIIRLEQGMANIRAHLKEQLKNKLGILVDESRGTGIITLLGKSDLIARIERAVEGDEEFRELLDSIDPDLFEEVIGEVKRGA